MSAVRAALAEAGGQLLAPLDRHLDAECSDLVGCEATIDPTEQLAITVTLNQLALTTPSCGQGLRTDLSLVDHDGPSTDLWCDVSCIHSTAAMVMPHLLTALRAEPFEPVVVSRKPYSVLPDSSAVADAAKRKHIKYAPLMQKGLTLHALGKLPRLPEFKACIATHAGEFGQGLISTVEWIVTRYRKNTAPAVAMMCGTSIAKATGRFRATTMDALATALAKGWAQQLLSVGYPLMLSSSTPSLPSPRRVS